MRGNWIIRRSAFGHYRLCRNVEADDSLRPMEVTSGIFFRAHEVDDVLDILEAFKEKQNSGN